MARKRMKVSNEEHKLTYDEAALEFIEAKMADGLAKPSIRNYEYSIQIFREYNNFNEDTLLEEIDEAVTNRWKNHLLKQDISYNSVNSYVRNIRIFLHWCAKRDYIEKIEMKDVRGQDTKIKYYTEEEMEELLIKPVGNNNYGAWRMWAVIAFIYATGARAQSVCDIKMEDLDFYKKEITFTHQKNKSLLILPMSEALEKTLKEYIRKCNLQNEEYLFPTITGEQLNPHTLNTAIRNYCISRDVPMRGVHAIRHAFASQYIRNGGNPVKLQKILNHSSFKMTEKYLHLFGEDLKVDYSDFSPLDVSTKKKSRTKRVGM